MAKLDPANWKSAKDVYDERGVDAAKKRKREVEGENAEKAESLQQESIKEATQPAKKQKIHNPTKSPKSVPTQQIAEKGESEEALNSNLKKRAKKRAHKKEKRQLDGQRRKERAERKARDKTGKTMSSEAQKDEEKTVKISKKAKREHTRDEPSVDEPSVSTRKTGLEAPGQQKTAVVPDMEGQQVATDGDQGQDNDLPDVDANERHPSEEQDDVEDESKEETEAEGEDIDMEDAVSTATSSEVVPDIMSPPADSAASSVSSIQAPPKAAIAESTNSNLAKSAEGQQEIHEPQPAASISEADRLAARQRLQEQIANFRTQRKADDKTPRSRAELLEQRRLKEEERKAAKKVQRQKEKEEEARRQDEEMARRFSPGGSGSLLASPRSPIVDAGPSGGGSYTFGRIAFEDGTTLDSTTLTAAEQRKHKGPQDTATALKAAQAKQARLAGLDDNKRADIAEKDMWLNARKRAHGEKIKDDQSLLKKALKRQEKQKSRSGTEWDKRIEGVKGAQEAKQKKRTENLQKRKDEKSANKTGASKKKVKRPGFEGSFRGRTGKAKKN